jgi:hypothetical protein
MVTRYRANIQPPENRDAIPSPSREFLFPRPCRYLCAAMFARSEAMRRLTTAQRLRSAAAAASDRCCAAYGLRAGFRHVSTNSFAINARLRAAFVMASSASESKLSRIAIEAEISSIACCELIFRLADVWRCF